MRRAILFLTRPDFFSKKGGMGGRVAHALGVISGLSRLDIGLDIVAGEGLPTGTPLRMGANRVHVIPGRTSLLPRLVWFSKCISAIDRLAQANPPDFVYVRYSASLSFYWSLLARPFGEMPLILEVNSCGARVNRRLGPCIDMFDRRTFEQASVLTVVSNDVADYIHLVHGNRFDEKVIVNPNGVDATLFEPGKRTLPRDNDPIRIVYAGSLEPYYDIDLLIEAFAIHQLGKKGFELHLVGTGPLHQAIHEKCEQLGDAALHFHGPVSFSEMPEILANGDVLVLPFLSGFGSPIKLYEYMASGTPVVASRVGQILEVIRDGENGLLYEPGDGASLANTLVHLAADPALGERLRAQARADVLAKHTWKLHTRTILDKLEEVRGKGATG